MKITKAVIGPMPKKFTDPLPKVTVTYEDNTVEELFEYLPDEISFSEEECVGKTRAEIMSLKESKDRYYMGLPAN